MSERRAVDSFIVCIRKFMSECRAVDSFIVCSWKFMSEPGA